MRKSPVTSLVVLTGDFLLSLGMLANDFFHPNHVVPSVKLAATLMEGSDFSET